MQKWEYWIRSAYTDRTSFEVLTHLQTLGDEGWELVTLYQTSIEDSKSRALRNSVVLILKRPKTDPEK